MTKPKLIQDIKAPKYALQRYQINRFFKHLQTKAGFVDGKAVIFVENKENPELSYILTDRL